MATIDQSAFMRYGAGDKSNVFVRVDKRVDLVMAAGATTAAQINLPAGAQRLSVAFETPVAFSGAPTSIMARVGTAAGGQQVVADIDVKAQAHVTGTIVPGFDQTAVAANGVTPLFLQIAATGGTAPAGTVSAYVGYAVPAEGL